MFSVSDLSVSALQEGSRYIRPLTLRYKQNGVARSWDMMRVHDSVAVLVHNVSRDVLVFVRQFRPAVYYSQLPEASCIDPSRLQVSGQLASLTPKSTPDAAPGVTLELCAGCVDKDLPLVDVAREELLEECGYSVTSERLRPIKSFVGSVGTAGSTMNLYFVSVTDQDKVADGGGNASEGEAIEVVELTVDEVRSYVSQPHVMSPPGFLFAIYWFFMHVVKQPL